MPEEPQRDIDLAELAGELRSLTEHQLGTQAREEAWRTHTLKAEEFVEQRFEEVAAALAGGLPQVRVNAADMSVARQIGFHPAAGPQPMADTPSASGAKS